MEIPIEFDDKCIFCNNLTPIVKRFHELLIEEFLLECTNSVITVSSTDTKEQSFDFTAVSDFSVGCVIVSFERSIAEYILLSKYKGIDNTDEILEEMVAEMLNIVLGNIIHIIKRSNAMAFSPPKILQKKENVLYKDNYKCKTYLNTNYGDISLTFVEIK